MGIQDRFRGRENQRGVASHRATSEESDAVHRGSLGEGCHHAYYAYHWWGSTNCDSTYQFFANGNLGQNIYVIPDQEVIIVHCGNSLQHYNDGDLRFIADKLRK